MFRKQDNIKKPKRKLKGMEICDRMCHGPNKTLARNMIKEELSSSGIPFA